MRKEIRISGFGGQGIALAGYILGKACALYEGYEAVMTQSYGPEARGGASSANIVIANNSIAYPFVRQPDVFIALSQEAYNKFRDTAKPDAIILTDEHLVTPYEDNSPFTIPSTRMAEELGRRIVANVVMLGFCTGILNFISRESMEKSIESLVKPKTLELNFRAFETGFEYALKQLEVVKEHPS
jgi:2-oxoglutarate ferredoxin oxidoreductase subunit gamma